MYNAITAAYIRYDVVGVNLNFRVESFIFSRYTLSKLSLIATVK